MWVNYWFFKRGTKHGIIALETTSLQLTDVWVILGWYGIVVKGRSKRQITADYFVLQAPIKWLFLGRFIFTRPLFLSPLCHSTKEAVQPFLFSSLLRIKPGAQPSIPSFPISPTITPFIFFCISVSWRSRPVGAERWQACVCLAPLSAFLMSLKHRGSAYYGDEEIQAGQKVMDLANRGPLRSLCPPSYLSSPFLFTPPLTLFLLPFSQLYVS